MKKSCIRGIGRGGVMLTAPWFLVACVSTVTHNAVLSELERTAVELAWTQEELVEVSRQQKVEREHSRRCELRLATADQENQNLALRNRTLIDEARRLRGEKGELTTERKALDQELEDLRRMRNNLYPDYLPASEQEPR